MPSRNVVSVSLTDEELAALNEARTTFNGTVQKAAFIRFAVFDFIARRKQEEAR